MGAKLAGGSGGSKRNSFTPNNEPNVIPFIDILLVLLIIFMVAAPIPTVDVKVDLPPPNALPSPNPKRPTVVDIRDQGGYPQIFVDGEVVEIDALPNKVVERVNFNVPGNPNPLLETVRIRADQTLTYRSIMSIMATLQAEGFTKVALVAEEALAPGATAPAQ